jgi:hypothetical protein
MRLLVALAAAAIAAHSRESDRATAMVTINAGAHAGSFLVRNGGTVTRVRHGQDATVALDVTSADGVPYTGTIQCSGISHY